MRVFTRTVALTVAAGVLVILLVGCTGTAQRVGSAEERLDAVGREAIAEWSQWNDLKVDRWKRLQALADAYGCNLPIGAVQRAKEAGVLTDEDIAYLDNLNCIRR